MRYDPTLKDAVLEHAKVLFLGSWGLVSRTDRSGLATVVANWFGSGPLGLMFKK